MIGSIRTQREMLLFLLIFMAHGVKSLEILVAKFIKKREQVQKLAKRIAKKFKANIVDGFVRFGNEELPDVPQAALIVDCTVCQVRRPKQPFSEAKVFFSGKHYIYALKKEVFVKGASQFRQRTIPPTHNSATYSFITILAFWFSTFLDLLPRRHSSRSRAFHPVPYSC